MLLGILASFREGSNSVGVARALAPNPNILLMDEPFGAVDPIIRQELQLELLRLQAD